jgi:hypothetical protein
MHFPKWAAAFDFVKSALSEPPTTAGPGAASFSRIAASFIIGFVLMWVTFIVFKTHTMPDLAGPTLFMTGGAGATYGANKVTTAVSNAIAGQQDASDDKSQAPQAPQVPTQVGN